MWMHQFDEFNDTKARNRLTLAERVKAIQAYEKTPVYQKVGLIFNCSAKQIRNIVKNKQKILALYASGQKSLTKKPPKTDETLRAKKIALLSEVMHEWFVRALRNPAVGSISYRLIQTVALEVKQTLNVENFNPNNAWLINFRQSYNITDQEMKEAHSDDPGPNSLDVKEIVECIEQRKLKETTSEVNDCSWVDALPGWNDDSLASSTLHVPNSVATTSSRASSSSLCNDDVSLSKFPKLEPVDVIEIDSDDDDDVAPKYNGRPLKRSAITSIEQALQHLKPLEEFALMKEDFRAIALISQLEVILTSAKAKQHANNSH